MLETLCRQVHQATVRLYEEGLTDPYRGVVTAYEERRRLVVTRARGIGADQLSPEKMLVVSGRTGQVIEGAGRPVSAVAAHDRIFASFAGIGAVVSCPSRYATMWAQAGRAIPCFGASHADFFAGPIPLAGRVADEVPAEHFHEAAGEQVTRLFAAHEFDPAAIPGCLVHQWGSLAWGGTVEDAFRNAALLERIAEQAYGTLLLNPAAAELSASAAARHGELTRKQDLVAATGRRRPSRDGLAS